MVERKSQAPEKESGSAEEWLEDKKKEAVSQNEFSPLPKFKETDDEPALTRRERRVSKECEMAVKTSLSDIEKVFPWLLKKEGYIKGELIQLEKDQRIEKLSIVGEKLHEAESLFGVLLQSLSRRDLREILPSTKDEELIKYAKATEGLFLSRNASGDRQISETFKKAWYRYCDLAKEEGSQEAMNRVMPGFGVIDPVEVAAFERSEEVRSLGEKLAESWAKEVTRGRPMTWEFRPDAYTQREVMTGVKIGGEIDLYFTAALDSVTRLIDGRGRVKAQVIDFKTGQKREGSRLERIIDKRQKQIMKLIAESFIAQYMVGYESDGRKKQYFNLQTKQDAKKEIDRTTVMAYRRFDKESGEMSLEEFGKEVEERENLNNWLKWYGKKVRKHELEVRKIMGADIWYDLSSVKLVK